MISNRAQLALAGTWIPLALICLGWTFKPGPVRLTLDAVAMLLVTVTTVVYITIEVRKRKKKKDNGE